MRRSWSTSFGVLLLAPWLIASDCKKDPPPVDGVDDGMSDGRSVQTFDETLAVVALQPGTVEENVPLRATLLGSGFVAGARVWVGARELDQVDVRSDREIAVMVPPLVAGRYDLEVVNPDNTNALLRQGLSVVNGDSTGTAACESLTLYFGSNESSLEGQALATLRENLECLRKAAAAVRIEGHCDERGTTDYNLALGQRRAESVSRFLATEGVSRRRLSTISYGEERPAERGSGESSWSKNRRVELTLTK